MHLTHIQIINGLCCKSILDKLKLQTGSTIGIEITKTNLKNSKSFSNKCKKSLCMFVCPSVCLAKHRVHVWGGIAFLLQFHYRCIAKACSRYRSVSWWRRCFASVLLGEWSFVCSLDFHDHSPPAAFFLLIFNTFLSLLLFGSCKLSLQCFPKENWHLQCDPQMGVVSVVSIGFHR